MPIVSPDQSRAEALDRIRKADMWFVVTATKNDLDEMAAFYTSGSMISDAGMQLSFLEGAREALESVGRSVVNEIDRRDEEFEDEDDG